MIGTPPCAPARASRISSPRIQPTRRYAQAKENLIALSSQQTGGSLQIARYYDKQRMYKAAIIYYNDVIRQQPTSPESEQAKKRLDTLRAKLGETVFNQATSTAPVQTANGVNKITSAQPGDGRLQAQNDTAKRSDYVGPPVSAPTPPPVVAPLSIPTTEAPAPESRQQPSRGEAQPPVVPEGEQPVLPTQ